jgi:hypothetical protein
VGLTVPFGLRGSEGSLAVECGVNGDPRRLGYHLLGLPYDLEVARGFPVVRASVSFPGEGYAGAMGWIQVLRYGSGGLGDERIEVDLPPQHQDSNTPYCFWGIQPTFFDAPSTPHEDVTWTAEAFLATSPDALMTRTVRPICGFRWGYATTRKPPQILPPESLDRGAWEAARPTLRQRFPAWDFLPF